VNLESFRIFLARLLRVPRRKGSADSSEESRAPSGRGRASSRGFFLLAVRSGARMASLLRAWPPSRKGRGHE
jgi:hypothetical protein